MLQISFLDFIKKRLLLGWGQCGIHHLNSMRPWGLAWEDTSNDSSSIVLNIICFYFFTYQLCYLFLVDCRQNLYGERFSSYRELSLTATTVPIVLKKCTLTKCFVFMQNFPHFHFTQGKRILDWSWYDVPIINIGKKRIFHYILQSYDFRD